MGQTPRHQMLVVFVCGSFPSHSKPNAVADKSSGASTVATMSYWPSVQQRAFTLMPNFPAISLKTSAGFGIFLTFLMPWSVKLVSSHSTMFGEGTVAAVREWLL